MENSANVPLTEIDRSNRSINSFNEVLSHDTDVPQSCPKIGRDPHPRSFVISGLEIKPCKGQRTFVSRKASQMFAPPSSAI